MIKIRCFALGGLDEVGKNLFVVEVNRDLFLFDCGLKILKEIDLGINSLVADFDYLVRNRHRIKGLFVTKIDVVNAYGIPFLLQKIPQLKIFVSKVSWQLLKESSLLSPTTLTNNVYSLDNQPLTFASNRIHCFYTATKLPGSCGFSLETLDGYIIYTGSLILTNNNVIEMFNTQMDKIVLNKNKTVLLLITDAGQLKIKDFIAPNHQIDYQLEKILFSFEDKLFVCCAENEWYKMFRIITKIQTHFPQQFVIDFFDPVFAKKFSQVFYAITKDVYWKQFFVQKTSPPINTSKKIIFLTGNQKWLFSRILSLLHHRNKQWQLRKNDHLWIVGEGTFIGELIVTQTLDQLHKSDAQITFTNKKTILPMEAGLEDIKLLINLFKPKYLFPTNARHQDLEHARKLVGFTHLKTEDIFIRENGEIVTIQGQNYQDHYEAIILQNCFVDNFSNTNINEQVITERKVLSEQGVIFVSFCYSKNKQKYFLNSEIQNHHFGITKTSLQRIELETKITQYLQNLFQKTPHLFANDNFKQTVRKNLTFLTKKQTGKNPLIFITANLV